MQEISRKGRYSDYQLRMSAKRYITRIWDCYFSSAISRRLFSANIYIAIRYFVRYLLIKVMGKQHAVLIVKSGSTTSMLKGRRMLTTGLLLLVPSALVVAVLLSANADWNADNE
jgi:hypothetical protein